MDRVMTCRSVAGQPDGRRFEGAGRHTISGHSVRSQLAFGASMVLGREARSTLPDAAIRGDAGTLPPFRLRRGEGLRRRIGQLSHGGRRWGRVSCVGARCRWIYDECVVV